MRADSIHEINHDGPHFRVKGPLNVPRPPQRRPLLVQAGSSPTGLHLAAKYADLLFTTQIDMEESRRFVAKVRTLLSDAGRHPASARVLPGLAPIVGKTTAKAAELAAEIGDRVLPQTALGLMSITFSGFDFSEIDLDAPFPDLRDVLPPNAQQSKPTLIMKMARDEKLTMRQVMRRMSSSYGHRQVVGTADEIADDMERWFVEEAADGFNIMAPDIPAGLADFTEHVVPRLQARGLFRTEYVDGTLRDNLGLPITDSRGERTPAAMP